MMLRLRLCDRNAEVVASLARLAAGNPLGGVTAERQRLDDLALVMTDASICGLGQTAASAVQSAFRLSLPGAAR